MGRIGSDSILESAYRRHGLWAYRDMRVGLYILKNPSLPVLPKPIFTGFRGSDRLGFFGTPLKGGCTFRRYPHP